MSWQDILKNEMNVKTLEEIAGELDKAVKAHTSQAKRIREIIAQYNTSESKLKVPQRIDTQVRMPTVPKTRGQQSMIDRATRNLREQQQQR